MKKLPKMLVFLTLAVFLGAGSAWALPFNSNRPYTPGPAWPGEDSLQTVFDNTFGAGVIDAVNDQSNVAVWTPAEANMDVYLVTFLTGTSGDLYVYSYGTGAAALLPMGGDNIASFAINASGDLIVDGSLALNGFGSAFGFYYDNPYGNPNSYTEDSENGTNGYGPDDNILALTYVIPSGSTAYLPLVNFGGANVSFTGDNDWILAFEDGSDGDFQDAIYAVEDINPVPEPASMLLLGSGLIGLAGIGRRKFFKKA